MIHGSGQDDISSLLHEREQRQQRAASGQNADGDANDDARVRRLNRAQLAEEIDASLTALREIYNAAAHWMALKEFIMQCDGEVSLVLAEHNANTDSEPRTPRNVPGARVLAAQFPDHTGETDVDNQLDNFADDVMASIALENEKREAERTPPLFDKTDGRIHEIEQTPKSVEHDGVLPCIDNEHVWHTVGEGASPDASQSCECGERIWNDETTRIKTGHRSRARSRTRDEAVPT